MQTITKRKTYPCTAIRKTVIIRRVYEVGAGIGGEQATPELLTEECLQEQTCPQFDQCPLRTG